MDTAVQDKAEEGELVFCPITVLAPSLLAYQQLVSEVRQASERDGMLCMNGDPVELK